MRRIRYLVLTATASFAIAICCVEVMRGEDPVMANKEAVTKDLTILALRAQDFYHRPASKGGGQGSFVLLDAGIGFSKLASKPVNPNGTYSILTAGTATEVVIHGQGTERGTNGVSLSIDMHVLPDSTWCVFNN
jgi:hypothetical protein